MPDAKEIEAASRRGEVLVPAICVWEVAMLESRGRITLSRPLEEWVRAALRDRALLEYAAAGHLAALDVAP